MFSSSTLISGILYKDKSENMNISQSITDNKGNSLVTKLVQTNKNLNGVQDRLNEWYSGLSEAKKLLMSNGKWTIKIQGNTSGNNRKIGELDTKLDKRNRTISYLTTKQKNAETKAENQIKFKTYLTTLEEKITKLQSLIENFESKSKSKKAQEGQYESKINELKTKLKEANKKKVELEGTISKYKDNRSTIEKQIKENTKEQNNFSSRKIISQKYLGIANKNQNIAATLSEKFKLQISENQKTINDLNNQKKNLEDETNKLQSDISFIQKS